MTNLKENSTVAQTEQISSRIFTWNCTRDFLEPIDVIETNLSDNLTDITSVSKCIEMREQIEAEESDGLIVEERTEEIKCGYDGVNVEKHIKEEDIEKEEPNKKNLQKTITKKEEDDPLIKNSSKLLNFGPSEKRKIRTTTTNHFTAAVEGEESLQQWHYASKSLIAPSRPSSRHKRHIDSANADRKKTRKRRTWEKTEAAGIFRYFLDAFLESMLIGTILVVLDVFINFKIDDQDDITDVPPSQPSWTYFF